MADPSQTLGDRPADSSAAIEVIDLTKVYDRRPVLDHVNLNVTQGSIHGFLGPNGAGKTTTIRILLGLARPTSGIVRLFGQDAVPPSTHARSRIGFLPDVPAFYAWMRAPEYLRFAGSLFGLRGPTLNERVDALLDLAGLTGVTTKVGSYSRGMKQRLGIAQAMINSPDLLILDEPTSALDPLGRHDVLELIARLGGRTTVLFSTHILSDVERVCDHISVLANGRVVAQDKVGELRKRYGGSNAIRLRVLPHRADVIDLLSAEPWYIVASQSGDDWLVSVNDRDQAAHRLPILLAEAGLGLLRCEPVEATLEDVFVSLVTPDREHVA